MVAAPPLPAFGPSYDLSLVTAIALCSAAIARLDARISVSLVASAWRRRAAWSGYARALQLQSADIEEIDVFSWGCELQIPGRPLRATHLDQFDAFAAWEADLGDPSRFAWRDRLPTSVGDPQGSEHHPPLIRALDRVRQLARLDGGIAPWLGLPFALRDCEAASTPLPCLAGGSKALRLKRTPQAADWLAAIRDLEARATAGLARLDVLERSYRDAQRAIVSAYRPGALPALLALIHHRPLVSPQSVSSRLGLSVAGASKLLERAQAAGLLVEITQRRSWRLFLSPDLATDFGLVAPKRGRPPHEPPPLPPDRELADVFDAFDAEMATIDVLLSRSG